MVVGLLVLRCDRWTNRQTNRTLGNIHKFLIPTLHESEKSRKYVMKSLTGVPCIAKILFWVLTSLCPVISCHLYHDVFVCIRGFPSGSAVVWPCQCMFWWDHLSLKFPLFPDHWSWWCLSAQVLGQGTFNISCHNQCFVYGLHGNGCSQILLFRSPVLHLNGTMLTKECVRFP